MRTFTRPSVSFKAMIVLVTLLGSVSLMGCKSFTFTGQPKLEAAAVSSVTAYRANLLVARKQVEQTLAATNAMPNSGSKMPKKFANFETEIANMHDAADVSNRQVASLQVNAAKHVAAWQTELNKLNNPDKNQIGEARAEVVQKHFEDIRAKAEEANKAYQPFLANLTEIDVYLQHDMTMRGVNVIKPIIAKSQATGEELISRINTVIASLDALSTEIANVATGDPAVAK